MNDMFCFQCEQTAGQRACTGKAGVCGKSAEVALLQDNLTGLLITLADVIQDSDKAAPTDEEACLIQEALFTTLTNVNFDATSVLAQHERINSALGDALSRAGRSDVPTPYDMTYLWNDREDLRSLKSLLLFGLRGMAAYAYHARALGYVDTTVDTFFVKGLAAIARENTEAVLLPLLMELGHVNLACMELLDRANTAVCGTPLPTQVPLTIEAGPFIVVSGHDLADLQQLLKQTDGRGINIYTHGEMLPAHAYPVLKDHPQLKGHFGTAWQNQQKEFANLPAPILFTTNCLMPVRESYADRVFTTGVVQYPGMVHIGQDKDFTPVIDMALRLGGYPQAQPMTGINGGSSLTTGFGHQATLNVAEDIIAAVKSGAIRHFFLVGGCDGARPGRNYYTEFVRQTPQDTVILTLACGKFRFNDMDLGSIGTIPRLIDMGQCNDAYSAIRVALALAEAFGCTVNELPLSLVLSWYEQKAVCILLTLLALGIRNIWLGPTLPAFVSPHILQYLVDTFNIQPITTPEKDLQCMLS